MKSSVLLETYLFLMINEVFDVLELPINPS